MYDVGLYRKVRLACHRDGMSTRHAALHFGINRCSNRSFTAYGLILENSNPDFQKRVVISLGAANSRKVITPCTRHICKRRGKI